MSTMEPPARERVLEDGARGAEAQDVNGCISMFMPNGYEAPIEEHVEYDDEGELICNMQGKGWESLPYPIVINSGAAASGREVLRALEPARPRHGLL